jgi:DNA-binding NarL/FixJ family response regulator
VLIVDEHGLLAEGIQPALEQCGIEVLGIATSSERVVSALSVGLPDVVVLCMWTQNGSPRQAAGADTRGPATGAPQVAVTPHPHPGVVSPAVLNRLTTREHQVLQLLAEGASNKDMARRLAIRSNTVRTHVQNLLSKLQVHTRLEAVTLAIRVGYVRSDDGVTVPVTTGRWMTLSGR